MPGEAASIVSVEAMCVSPPRPCGPRMSIEPDGPVRLPVAKSRGETATAAASDGMSVGMSSGMYGVYEHAHADGSGHACAGLTRDGVADMGREQLHAAGDSCSITCGGAASEQQHTHAASTTMHGPLSTLLRPPPLPETSSTEMACGIRSGAEASDMAMNRADTEGAAGSSSIAAAAMVAEGSAARTRRLEPCGRMRKQWRGTMTDRVAGIANSDDIMLALYRFAVMKQHELSLLSLIVHLALPLHYALSSTGQRELGFHY